MLYVQVVYDNGIIVETKAMNEAEAIAKAKELLRVKNAEYESVRVMSDDGRQIFDQQVRP